MNTLKLNNIGNYYKAVGNYARAFEYYTKASHCQDDRFDMARIQINIGAIYGITNDCRILSKTKYIWEGLQILN